MMQLAETVCYSNEKVKVREEPRTPDCTAGFGILWHCSIAASPFFF